MSTDIRLVVLDMAGTTVADDGLVERAFQAASEALGVEAGSPEHQRMLEHVRATMGESKISVFRHLFGDEQKAQQANQAFEAGYHDLVDSGHCEALPGAAEAIAELRAQGRKVVLTTGFSRATQDQILRALGWERIADLTLCPADAGRGRPTPTSRSPRCCAPARTPSTRSRWPATPATTCSPASGPAPPWWPASLPAPTTPTACARTAPRTCSARWPNCPRCSGSRADPLG